MQVTLSYLLERCASKFPTKIGLITEKGRYTFREWEENANHQAELLAKVGIRKGDRVATLFRNSREALEIYPALWKLGAVVVPLNIRLSVRELTELIKISSVKAVVFGSEFQGLANDVRSVWHGKEMWIECDEGSAVWWKEVGREEARPTSEQAQEKDVACILYTAGTVGKPKGVMLTHSNLVWGAVNLAQDSYFRPHLKVLLVFPLFHAAAIGLLNASLYLGCTIVSLSKFSAEGVLEVVEREKVGKLAFPPTVWNAILESPDVGKYDLSCVESVSSGAAPMPPSIRRRLREVFRNACVGETYGMTETAATITTIIFEEEPEGSGCVGRPFTNVEVKVVDEKGREVAEREVGEIIVRGPNVMIGYLEDPDLTKVALREGWLYTGDLGYFDERGLLYLVGRKKEIIISGGENIHPQEVEEVLLTHPDVSDAAVVGVPDHVWGERVHAFVVKKSGSNLREEEVMEYCKGRIAGYKRPRSVQFVKYIPRSPAGKVLRRELRKLYCENKNDDPSY
ncbi:MAG: AMP-binding protein [Candidatus Methanomethylicaceae archaeon]